MPNTLPKSKRLRFAVGVLIANFVVVIFGMWKGTDLVALGTCLMMINAPLYVYILGDSYRPSNTNDINK
jgi:hypothetical protein